MIKTRSLPIFMLLHIITTVTASTDSLDKPFQTEFKRLPLSPCVTLFHRNGRVGCGTYSRDKMNGRLLHWSTLTASTEYYSDLEPTLPSFVAILEDDEFTLENIDQLKKMNENNKLLQGILVLNNTSTLSPASTTPRGKNTPSYQLTPDYEYEWNVNGNGILSEDLYGLPTGYVSDADIGQYLLEKAKEQSELLLSTSNGSSTTDTGDSGGVFSTTNVNIPPVQAQFNLYMGPEDATSPTCLSWTDNDGVWRPKCLPLGGNSVWAKAGSPISASDNNDDNSELKSIILVGTNIDSTSMFHDIAPGANTAASNILTLLMAAKLLGESVDDATLDGFDKSIVFAFFQGEQYGYIGSRSFLRDVAYPGFECDVDRIVSTVSKKTNDESYGKRSCLYPMRYDLDFTKLRNIESMIAIDQIGILNDDNSFYVHDSGNNNGLKNIILSMSSDDWTINEGSAGSIPPTPLSSLVNLSEGNIGGVVLTGYDEAFANDAQYLSHADSNSSGRISLEAIAKAATFIARAALASVYDGNNGNYADAAAYAEDLITELDSTDETLVDLSNCLFINGKCDTMKKYSSMERMNNKIETGIDVGVGDELGTKPNYYVSIYDGRSGQPYAYIGERAYGSYTGELNYGDSSGDVILVRPNVLETGIHGLLDDFLGRGTNGDTKLTSCQSLRDCESVSYCANVNDFAVCTGSKVCVCSRSHYHQALDEALVPAPNNSTGMFLLSTDDEGVSPIYTEPYWDSDIGVRVYREGEQSGGWIVGIGFALTAIWVVSTIFMRKKLQKEKLY